MNKYLYARELFFRYDGSYFQMVREDEFETYKKYNVPLIIEYRWCNQLLHDILTQINTATNNKIIEKGVSRYCSILCNRGNFRRIKPIIQYIVEHAKRLDTFTLCLSIESVFEVVTGMRKSIYYRKQCNSISALMICVLEENMNSGITVSNDYIVEGSFPDYLAKDKLKLRILTDIKGWRCLWNY